MPPPRFYAPHLDPADGGEVRLPADESRHLVRVLRLRAGSRVRVFDGRGRERNATVARADPRGVVLVAGAPAVPAAEARVRVTLGVALLKGRQLDGVIRDATTLGVDAVIPIRSGRAQAGGAGPADARIAARWRGIAVAAAKQCGRAVVPAIPAPAAFADFVAAAPPAAARYLLVEPAAADAAAAGAAMTALRTAPPPARAVIAIGPEGGWTGAETALARDAGFTPLTLGPRTLRAETAPVAALSILRFAWRDP